MRNMITVDRTRFLMVSRSLPYDSGGSMIVLRRLLEHFQSGEAYVLGRTPFKSRTLDDNTLTAHLTEIPTPRIRGYRYWMMISVLPGLFLGLRLIRKYRIPVIIGVYPDAGSLLLSYLLSRISGIPLMAYFCDLYSENYRKSWWETYLAKWLQPRIFKRGRIISVNEAVRDFYQKKYGIDSLLLPTAITGRTDIEVKEFSQENGRFVIGYSGTIIPDRLDPMQALVKCIGGDSRFELRLFTPQEDDYLMKNHLVGENISRKFCKSANELVNELKKCQLLYLPLTFKTGNNSFDQLATCFGIKSYEYFLAGVPILVHSPSDYFTFQFFEKRKCAFLLSSICEDDIRQVLNDIHKNYSTKASGFLEKYPEICESFQGEKLAKILREDIYKLVHPNASIEPGQVRNDPGIKAF